MAKSNKNIYFLIFLVLFEFAVYMSNDMILPALIDVVKEFQVSESLVPLSLSIFLLGSLSIQLFVGPISDRYGRRYTMFVGGIIVLIGNIIGILASNMPNFFVARILQGMGPCFIGVAGYACVHELYKEKEAINVISWMASVALFAPMIGPLAGSTVMLFAGWRYIFVTTFLLSLIGLIGLWFFMPETLTNDKKIKIRLKPILTIYLDLIKNKNFIFGSISFALSFGSVIVWISSSPIVLMNLYHLNKSEFSLVQIPIFLAFILGTFTLRYLSKFMNSFKSLTIGFTITFISSIVTVLFSYFVPNNLYLIIAAFTCFNFGYGILSAPFTRLILDSTTQSKGMASALLYFMFFIIGSLFSAMFGIFYNETIFSFTLYIAIILFLSLIIGYKSKMIKFIFKESN